MATDLMSRTPGVWLRACLVPVVIVALAAFMTAPLFVHPENLGVEDWDQNLFKLAAPYLQNLDPTRIAAVASVLRRLEILQKEGVVLTMPEILPQ